MRVLLIEDHADLAANIGDYLAAQSCQVDFAADGEQGLQLARAAAHDVLIVDRMLPRLDGARLCQQLRALQIKTPVLMLTAMGRLEEKLQGFQAGVDDYLVKPFALSELWARVQALSRRGGREPVLQLADLQFDRRAQQARRGRRELSLNPTTRRLLEHLLQNAGRLVTRAELEEFLWGDALPGSDALRTHIHALRRAVDGEGEPNLLHTVHGSGWRLSVP